jgi:hypothetical protein
MRLTPGNILQCNRAEWIWQKGLGNILQCSGALSIISVTRKGAEPVPLRSVLHWWRITQLNILCSAPLRSVLHWWRMTQLNIVKCSLDLSPFFPSPLRSAPLPVTQLNIVKCSLDLSSFFPSLLRSAPLRSLLHCWRITQLNIVKCSLDLSSFFPSLLRSAPLRSAPCYDVEEKRNETL